LLGTKKYFLRTLPPSHFCAEVTKNIFLAARATQLLQKRLVKKKVTARAVKTEQTATGHKKKLHARH
jgi:hypothetical protein